MRSLADTLFQKERKDAKNRGIPLPEKSKTPLKVHFEAEMTTLFPSFLCRFIVFYAKSASAKKYLHKNLTSFMICIIIITDNIFKGKPSVKTGRKAIGAVRAVSQLP